MEAFRPLSPGEIARRSGSAVHRAGVFEASAATVQPALLARGLRRVALAAGVRIFEHTRVRSFGRGHPVVVRCDGGRLTADRLVVATNAWAAGLRELAGRLVAITSDMVMTAPAPDRLHAIGWTGGECITDSQMMVDYYHATRDGRVAFGKGGWGIAFGGRIGADFDRNARRARIVEADLRRTYPALADVPVTHDWSGPIDRTPTSLPLLGRLGGRPHILYGVGWSGNGVGPSVVGGRILASLALAKTTAGAGTLWSIRSVRSAAFRASPSASSAHTSSAPRWRARSERRRERRRHRGSTSGSRSSVGSAGELRKDEGLSVRRDVLRKLNSRPSDHTGQRVSGERVDIRQMSGGPNQSQRK